MQNPSGSQAGIAGEYLVAGELCRRGCIASLTLRNTKGVDILAASADASKSVAIQVKTNQGDHPRWPLGKNAEAHCANGFFYVLVNLHHGGHPTYHVVPSHVVAQFARTKSGSMRTFEDKSGEYSERWDLLGL